MKEVKKFALFAGPRLLKVISGDGIALVGDASHRQLSLRSWKDTEQLIYSLALSGAFGKKPISILILPPYPTRDLIYQGAGAGFALEDVYVLTQAVKWAYERGYPMRDALDIYDRVRSQHYEAMV